MLTGFPFDAETRKAYHRAAAPPPAPFGTMKSEVVVKMPPRDVTLLRYYYWPANTEPKLDPMPLAEALLLAKSLDVEYGTRAPQDLLKGLDKDAILSKAIDKGLIASDVDVADKDIYSLIFSPGFSTAEKVTNVSGRGSDSGCGKSNKQCGTE